MFGLIIVIAASSAAWATEYYVSTSGSDSNSGTSPNAPWKSLTYAESKAIRAGDIIYLKRGDTWTINQKFVIDQGGDSSNYITWDGGSWGTGDKARIQTFSAIEQNFLVNIRACAYLNFKNIIIDGNNSSIFVGLMIGGDRYQNNEHHINIQGVEVYDIGDGDWYSHNMGVRTWNNNIHTITFENCVLDGSDDQALILYPAKTQILSSGLTPKEMSNITVRNCRILNFARRNSEAKCGILVTNRVKDSVLEFNSIYNGNNSDGGIRIQRNDSNSAYHPVNIICRYNLIYNPGKEGISITNGGDQGLHQIYGNILYGATYANIRIGGGNFSGTEFLIYNNTIYNNNGSYGIIVGENMSGGAAQVRNNLIYTDGDIAIRDTASQIAGHSNNHLYNSSGGSLVQIGSTTYSASNVSNWERTVQTANPSFVNRSNLPKSVDSNSGPNTDGLAVLSNSDAVDNGLELTTLGSYYEDYSINLVNRPKGGGWDIGAHEYTTQSSINLEPPLNLRIVQ